MYIWPGAVLNKLWTLYCHLHCKLNMLAWYFVSLQMILLVWTSLLGATWFPSMEFAITSSMANSAANHAHGRTYKKKWFYLTFGQQAPLFKILAKLFSNEAFLHLVSCTYPMEETWIQSSNICCGTMFDEPWVHKDWFWPKYTGYY